MLEVGNSYMKFISDAQVDVVRGSNPGLSAQALPEKAEIR